MILSILPTRIDPSDVREILGILEIDRSIRLVPLHVHSTTRHVALDLEQRIWLNRFRVCDADFGQKPVVSN